ncbi:MAG: hypothetical protein IPK81_25130 [Rhodospirillales bacterium]|nr:MAG: hypothetical protein IPK81_25130 [Rhodospirillales bacterium]
MTGRTTIGITGDGFTIDGRPTYEGRRWGARKIEGLLLNSRMANAVIDDVNPATRGVWAYADGPWDADRSTREFVAALPSYRAHGLLAVSVNLQGGSPQGYSWNHPWVTTGFAADGALKPDYARRILDVLRATDALGMAVILGCFYGRQTGHLADEAACLRAVDEVVELLVAQDCRNALIEIGNEVDLPWFAHDVIAASRGHEMIKRVKERSSGRLRTPAGRLLASTSFAGGAAPPDNVVAEADYLLLHGNHVESPEGIRRMVRETRARATYRGQPVAFNEDDHYDFHLPDNNMRAAVDSYASWGFFDYRRIPEKYPDGFQSLPVDWGINSFRKRAFFGYLKEITGV